MTTELDTELRRIATAAHLARCDQESKRKHRRQAKALLLASGAFMGFLGYHLFQWAGRSGFGQFISAWLD